MIKICDVYKKYDNKELFRSFSLDINSGDFVVITGESGCGKTTLLNMIGGLVKADKGQILIDGIDINEKKNIRNLLRTKIGFLFQNFALIESKTVSGNLAIVSGKARNNVTDEEALAAVNMLEKAQAKAYTLSGGEQQRIAIARLMIKKCDIILADEPTGSLDKRNGEVVMELLKKLNEAGKTIVMVTHDNSLIQYANVHIAL